MIMIVNNYDNDNDNPKDGVSLEPKTRVSGEEST